MKNIPTISVKLSTKLDDASSSVKIRTSLSTQSILTPKKSPIKLSNPTKATIFQQTSTNKITKIASLRIFRAINEGSLKKNPKKIRNNFFRLVKSLWFATHANEAFPEELLETEWNSITRGGIKEIDRSRFHSWWIGAVTTFGEGMVYAESSNSHFVATPVVILERLIRYFEMLADTLINENDNTLRSLADITKSPILLNNNSNSNRATSPNGDHFSHFGNIPMSQLSPSGASTPNSPLRKINTAPNFTSNHSTIPTVPAPGVTVHDFSLSKDTNTHYGRKKKKVTTYSSPDSHIQKLLTMKKQEVLHGPNHNTSSVSPRTRATTAENNRIRGLINHVNSVYNLEPTATQLSRQQTQRLNNISQVRRRPSLSESLTQFESVEGWGNETEDSFDNTLSTSNSKYRQPSGSKTADNNNTNNNDKRFNAAKEDFWNMPEFQQRSSTAANHSLHQRYNQKSPMGRSKSTITIKPPKLKQRHLQRVTLKSPGMPFRASKIDSKTSPIKSKGIFGEKIKYECEQWWEQPNKRLSPLKHGTLNFFCSFYKIKKLILKN